MSEGVQIGTFRPGWKFALPELGFGGKPMPPEWFESLSREGCPIPYWDHKDAACSFDWEELIPDAEYREPHFDVLVRSPEGVVKTFRMGTDWIPDFFVAKELEGEVSS